LISDFMKSGINFSGGRFMVPIRAKLGVEATLNLAVAGRFGVPALAGRERGRLKPGLRTQKPVCKRFTAQTRQRRVGGVLLRRRTRRAKCSG